MKTQKIKGIKVGKPFAIKKLAVTNRILSYMLKKHPNVAFAYDALEPVQITLSDSDIKNGIAKNNTKCAFSNAACRMLKADDAYVGIRMACLKFGNKLVRFKIPESVSREIVCFDRHRDCDAAHKSYRFSAVTGDRALGRPYRESAEKNGNSTAKKPRKGQFLDRHMTKHIRKSKLAVDE